MTQEERERRIEAADWSSGEGRGPATALTEGAAGLLREALAGVRVQMDGETVGHLVSATVDGDIGEAAWAGRYARE